MKDSINNPEYIGACQDLIREAYSHVIEYVKFHEDDIYIFLTDEDDNVISTIVSNHSVGFSYDLFDEEINSFVEEGKSLTYLSKFAGLGNLNRRRLLDMFDYLVDFHKRQGYDYLIAAVSGGHAKVWNRLYGMEIITEPRMVKGHKPLQLMRKVL